MNSWYNAGLHLYWCARIDWPLTCLCSQRFGKEIFLLFRSSTRILQSLQQSFQAFPSAFAGFLLLKTRNILKILQNCHQRLKAFVDGLLRLASLGTTFLQVLGISAFQKNVLSTWLQIDIKQPSWSNKFTSACWESSLGGVGDGVAPSWSAKLDSADFRVMRLCMQLMIARFARLRISNRLTKHRTDEINRRRSLRNQFLESKGKIIHQMAMPELQEQIRQYWRWCAEFVPKLLLGSKDYLAQFWI